jgi:hypothetical protein
MTPMKKLMYCFMMAFVLLSIVPAQSKAAAEKDVALVAVSKPVESTDANAKLARLEEIKAMDMSKLNRSEKKELLKEVRSIRDDQYGYGHGRRNHNGGGDRNYGGHHRGGYYMGGTGLLVLLLIILLM